MDKKKLNIHLNIAGKPYPLTIDLEDEIDMREAARRLENKINQYRRHFSSSAVDEKDLLAMVAFQLTVDNMRLEKRDDVGPFVEKIETLNDKLEDYLGTR